MNCMLQVGTNMKAKGMSLINQMNRFGMVACPPLLLINEQIKKVESHGPLETAFDIVLQLLKLEKGEALEVSFHGSKHTYVRLR